MFSDTIKLSAEIMNELLDLEINKSAITEIISVITDDIRLFNISLTDIAYPVNTDKTFMIEVRKNEIDNNTFLNIVVGPRDWDFDIETGERTGSGMFIG